MPLSEFAMSETARATAASESRYRINGPNSLPRAVKVVAVDASSDAIVAALAPLPWGNAAFLSSGDRDLVELERTDLIVLIATAGHEAAQAIGSACRPHDITVMALVVDDGADASRLTATLARLRPYCRMLVVTTSSDFVADLLTALQA